jgi:hypothetical protein
MAMNCPSKILPRNCAAWSEPAGLKSRYRLITGLEHGGNIRGGSNVYLSADVSLYVFTGASLSLNREIFNSSPCQIALTPEDSDKHTYST